MPQQKVTDFDKVFAALSYVWVLFAIPFVLGHHKPFVYHHAKQGLALFIAELILLLIAWIPLLGWLVAGIGWVLIVLAAVVGIAYALAGEEWQIPILGKMVKK